MVCAAIIAVLLLSAPVICNTRSSDGSDVNAAHEIEGRQRSHYTGYSCNGAFVQQIYDDLARQQSLQAAQALQSKLLEAEYRQRGIDPVWATQAARNVNTRCTVINFKNGGMLAHQVIPPSPLPQGFVEDFGSASWFQRRRARHRSSAEFMREFKKGLLSKPSAHSCQDHAPYARAAMRQWWTYKYPNFCIFLRNLCAYDAYMPEIAAQIIHDHEFAGKVREACEIAPTYIQREAQRITDKTLQHAADVQRAQEEQARLARQQALLVEQQCIRDSYNAQEESTLAEGQEWCDLHGLYTTHGFEGQTHLDARMQALREMRDAGALYTDKTYQIGDDVSQLLGRHSCATEPYQRCYGNQLQQVIHQECINLLGCAEELSSAHSGICSQEVFVDCVDAAREYNQSGMVAKASQVADLCWAMIGYGKRAARKIAPYAHAAARQAFKYGGAIIEGGVHGALMAGKDLIDHPVQTALCAVAGEYVLAYQLCKVLYSMLDLGATALADPAKARAQWDEYMAPINGVIDAMSNREIALRDAVAVGVTMAVGWKAQARLLKGMRALYSGAKIKAVEYVRRNPLATPAQFAATSEGANLQPIRSSACPATCPNQYTKLKEALGREQFASITHCSEHGLERLIQRGFSSDEVFDLLNKPHQVVTQRDGVRVFIRSTADDRYSFIAFNQQTGKVVTALKNLRLKKMVSLAKGYGWKLEVLET